MTGNLSCLTEWCDIVSCSVGLPNGEEVMGLKEGIVNFGGELNLKHVLFMPNLKCNLIYVSQLLNGSNLVVQVTNKIYVIQKQSSRKLIGVGEQREGLYFLKGVVSVHTCKTIGGASFEL